MFACLPLFLFLIFFLVPSFSYRTPILLSVMAWQKALYLLDV